MGVQPKGGGIAGLFKLFSGHKLRASERSARDSSVYLFSETTFIGQANLVDESEGGAKVSSPTPDILKRARYLLNPATASVNTLALAWSSGREAGFQYSAKKRLRGYIDDPKIEHVQAYWNAVSGNHALNAPRGVFGKAR
ncbi:MAG: hypothetical protein ACYDD1_08300 [Caulobacteraceae bacterium]